MGMGSGIFGGRGVRVESEFLPLVFYLIYLVLLGGVSGCLFFFFFNSCSCLIAEPTGEPQIPARYFDSHRHADSENPRSAISIYAWRKTSRCHPSSCPPHPLFFFFFSYSTPPYYDQLTPLPPQDRPRAHPARPR